MKFDSPIPHSSLFVTPESLADLDFMIRELSNDAERAIAYRYTMFAFNLAHKLVKDEQEATV